MATTSTHIMRHQILESGREEFFAQEVSKMTNTNEEHVTSRSEKKGTRQRDEGGCQEKRGNKVSILTELVPAISGGQGRRW